MLRLVTILAVVASATATGDQYPTVPVSEFDCSAHPYHGTDHFYESPYECNEFYRCVPGYTLAYLYTCPEIEEVFDESQQLCVWKYNFPPPCGTMDPNATTTTTTASMNTGTVVSATPDPTPFYCDGLAAGHYPDPDDCTQFYKCDDNSLDGVPAIVQHCPSGLIFNPDTEYCDWPYNVASYDPATCTP